MGKSHDGQGVDRRSGGAPGWVKALAIAALLGFVAIALSHVLFGGMMHFGAHHFGHHMAMP